MFYQSVSNPNGITENMIDCHRENAVVLVFRGILRFLMVNAVSGIFPFISVCFGGCLPIVSPVVSP